MIGGDGQLNVSRQTELAATESLLPLPPNTDHDEDESDAAYSEHQDKHRTDKDVPRADEPEKCLLSHGGPPSDSVAEGVTGFIQAESGSSEVERMDNSFCRNSEVLTGYRKVANSQAGQTTLNSMFCSPTPSQQGQQDPRSFPNPSQAAQRIGSEASMAPVPWQSEQVAPSL
jgi:hypothetical protein